MPLRVSGCASYPSYDSIDFIEVFRDFVVDTSSELHDWVMLPVLPADSVQWGGTTAQCDTAAARFQRFRIKETGNTTWPLVPVALLRIGQTRWVADPHVGNADGIREWAILDSSFTMLKIIKTVP